MVELNKLSVAEAMKIREKHEEEEGGFRVYICGQIGPRGDGYVPGENMGVDESAEYHSTQIQACILFLLLVGFQKCQNRTVQIPQKTTLYTPMAAAARFDQNLIFVLPRSRSRVCM